MNQKKYSVSYLFNKELFTIICSKSLLPETIEKLIHDGVDVIGIVRQIGKNLTLDDFDKQKYYKSKYAFFSKKYKSNKITKETFDDIIQKLKQLKNECKTKCEFEMKFEEYKKTNNILQYTVSK